MGAEHSASRTDWRGRGCRRRFSQPGPQEQRYCYGQSSVPTGLGTVIAVAAGGSHSLALKNDGTVVAWGDNSAGQSSVPTGPGTVIAVAAGGYHSLGLRNDGTVVAWGDDSYGQ